MRLNIYISLLLILFSIISTTADAQTSRYRPFKLVIVTPDTATIDSKFNPYIDSIQREHLAEYYKSVEQMKRMVNFKGYSSEKAKELKEGKERLKKALTDTDKMESEAKKFKYYQTISEYSYEVLNMYFNEYPPLSTIEIAKVQNVDHNNLSHLADSAKADYIVYYRNIHSDKENNRDVLKLTTILYSNSDHKILFEKETAGDTDSRGDMWSCSYPLSCLLVSGVKTSTDLIFSEIRQRQLK